MLEKLLLERLGWKYHRVYSTAWINNYEVEKNRLLDALIVDDIVEAVEENESYLAVDDSDNSLESKFDKYEELSVDFLKKLLSKYGLKQTIIELVKYEGPIHEEYLLRRVASMLDKSRVTNVVKNLVNQNMSSVIIKSNRFYYVDLAKSYKLRLGAKRDIDEIHLNELKNGILTIVTANNGITKEGCFKALVSLLGYNRVTENTVKVLEDVLIHLKLDGAITQRGECLYV